MFDEIDTEDFTDEERRDRVVSFMQFVNDMDRSRGLSFKAIAPEAYAAVAAYHGHWDDRSRYFGAPPPAS